MSNLSTFVKRIRNIMRQDAGINGDAQRIEQIAWMLFLKVYDTKEQEWQFADAKYVSIIPENCRWSNWAQDRFDGKALTGDALLDFVNNTLFRTFKNLELDADTPVRKSIVKAVFADANNYMKNGVLLRQIINIVDELDLTDNADSHAFGEIYESILRELQNAGSAGEFYTPRALTDVMAHLIRPKVGERCADFACGTGGFLASWLKEARKAVKTSKDMDWLASSVHGVEKKPFPYLLAVTNMLLHGVDNLDLFRDNSLIRPILDYTAKDAFDVILMNPPYGGSEEEIIKKNFPGDLASSETADLFLIEIMYRLKRNGRAAVVLPDGLLFGTGSKANIKRRLLEKFNLHTVLRLPPSVFAPYTSIATNVLFFDNTHPTRETWFYRMDMPEGLKHFSKTKPLTFTHFAPLIAWWDRREEADVDGVPRVKRYTAAELIAGGCNFDLCGFPHEETEVLPPDELMAKYASDRAALNAKITAVLAKIGELL